MKSKLIILLGILVFATFLRVYQLNSVPPALFGDEVDVGYQAYSLLKTGRDIQNRFMPFYLGSLAEYRTPLYIYSAVPFVGIFGLNEWGVRLPAVFWGILSILGVYLLTRKILNEDTGLITSFLLTISPWHLQYSRASFEVTMLLSFIIFGTYFFLIGLKKNYYLLLSFLLFGLSIYIYSTAVVFVPLWVLALLLIYRKELPKNGSYTPLFGLLFVIILVIIVTPFLWGFISGEARGRFQIVSIFQDSVLLDKINLAQKGEKFVSPNGVSHTVNPGLEKIFHNKPLVFAQVFTLNYLRAFSPEFLFTQGDPNFRQSIFEMGELYYFEIFTILLGIWILCTRLDQRVKFFILGWLLLSPIPAALTRDGGYHATRLFIMLPALVMLSAIGVATVYKNLKRPMWRNASVFLVFLFLCNVFFYFHRYYLHYPVESWRWWHVGFKEALTYVDENQSKYNQIIVNNSYEPSFIRFLFFSKYDPATFHKQFVSDRSTQNIITGIDGFTFSNKYIFGNLNEQGKKNGGFESIMKKGMLYVASARDETEGDLRTYQHRNFKVVKTIVDPTNTPIFYILEGT